MPSTQAHLKNAGNGGLNLIPRVELSSLHTEETGNLKYLNVTQHGLNVAEVCPPWLNNAPTACTNVKGNPANKKFDKELATCLQPYKDVKYNVLI